MNKDKSKDMTKEEQSKKGLDSEAHKKAYEDMNDLNDAAGAFYRERSRIEINIPIQR